MADFPDEVWKSAVDAQSLELMQAAIDLTGTQDALQAIAALCMAAGRAAGMAHIPLSVAMELFIKQWELIQVVPKVPTTTLTDGKPNN